MSAPVLHPYQANVIAEFDRTRESKRRIILVAPTGSGKTIIAGAIIQKEIVNYGSVLVLSHRREITKHTSEKLQGFGIGHGIIQAGFSPRPLERVQVASIQTLHRRTMQSDAMYLPSANLVFVDECHHAPAKSWREIIEAYPNATILGATATPCRGDGHGLGGIFETMIEAPQVPELIALGYLVGTRTYAPINPDLTGVHTVAGDFVEDELADRMDRAELIGDIVTHWHKYGDGRRTVAFCVNVAHSIHLCDEFVRAGVCAEHIDGSTPKDERDATLARLATGEIQVVCNCMVLTEGWDMPNAGTCILARPTKKMGLYRQMVGRVLRSDKGKPDAIVLDHSGAVFRHGFVEDPVDWTLDPDKRAANPKHQQRGTEGGSRVLECTQCGAVRVAGQPCFNCGYLPVRPPRNVEILDGELGLVGRNRKVRNDLNDPNLRSRWHGMLAYISDERGYKAGWVAHQYKQKFGTWPPCGARVRPEPPTGEVRSWVRSRLIAFAKRSA